jgi:hypothetical protein
MQRPACPRHPVSRMARWQQGWQSSLVAAVVLVLIALVCIAGVAAVALLSNNMLALAQ